MAKLRKRPHTKIVATLGPASTSPATIKQLYMAGVDMFRLNFSHGSHEDHRERYETIRALEAEVGRPIAILMDLQGPKLRVGTFPNGSITLRRNASFRLDMEKTEGSDERVSLPHKEVFAALEKGTNLLLDDGKIRLRVQACGPDFAETKVMTGGRLSDRKGVNVPGAVLPISPLTAKDRKDMQFGLDLGVDWVALSFVQRPEDIAEARRLVAGRAAIMAKLEKPAAIDHLEQIVELSDGIMVARGDLGVELPPESVPVLQKQIVRTTRYAGKPVVVATQMLESMVNSPTPTRAEASDVATAVYEGADAVMLSAESAAGQYPVEAVRIMDRIIEQVESDENYFQILANARTAPEPTAADAISAAARQVAQTLSAKAIMTYTTSGSTTMRASRERPSVPIVSMTPEMSTARRLCCVWGVYCVHSPDATNFDDMTSIASNHALDAGLAKRGDRVIVTAGVPFGTPGATNVIRIARVD